MINKSFLSLCKAQMGPITTWNTNMNKIKLLTSMRLKFTCFFTQSFPTSIHQTTSEKEKKKALILEPWESSWSLGSLSTCWNFFVYAQMYNTLFHLVAFIMQRAEANYLEYNEWVQSIETLLFMTMPSYFICS